MKSVPGTDWRTHTDIHIVRQGAKVRIERCRKRINLADFLEVFVTKSNLATSVHRLLIDRAVAFETWLVAGIHPQGTGFSLPLHLALQVPVVR